MHDDKSQKTESYYHKGTASRKWHSVGSQVALSNRLSLVESFQTERLYANEKFNLKELGEANSERGFTKVEAPLCSFTIWIKFFSLKLISNKVLKPLIC